jgi:hypothetical protein
VTGPARTRQSAPLGNVEISAVDDDNLLGVLERNDARAALEAGQLHCTVCGRRLTIRNFGAVARRNRTLVFACATWACRRAIS